MKQRGYGRDPELAFRMFFTIIMLALVYVAFMGLLFWAGISPILILIFAVVAAAFQYFGSDKIVGDIRFRLINALQQRGIHTHHACVALKKASARSPSPKSSRRMCRRSLPHWTTDRPRPSCTSQPCAAACS